jgi:uncharacterized lipoprotein YmbA
MKNKPFRVRKTSLLFSARRIAAFALVGAFALLLHSCTIFPETAPARLYAIELPASPVLAWCPIRFAVREIRVPGYLDRAEVLLAKTNSRIEISALHLWAAPTTKELSRLINQGLKERLGGSQSMPYPVRLSEKPEWMFSLEIDRLDLEDNELRLDISFAAIAQNSPSEASRASYRANFSSKVQLPSDATTASAQASRFANGLGQAIDRALKDLTLISSSKICLA